MYHFWLDFDVDEHFAVVDTGDGADHLWQDNHGTFLKTKNKTHTNKIKHTIRVSEKKCFYEYSA